MKTEEAVDRTTPRNEISRRTMLAHREHFFFSNWRRVVMIHYAVEPEFLQPYVPFELELYEGKAYVSCVAFYLQNLRPTFGGTLGAALMKPIANHEFLNVRTYVRHKGEGGIYFLVEYLPNLLSAQLGPPLCGLPYRHAQLNYDHEAGNGEVAGEIKVGPNRFAYGGKYRPDSFGFSMVGSLPEFLFERYTAFTWRKGIVRYFRVWHPPWCHADMNVKIIDDTLLKTTGEWFEHAELVGAHYSAGFDDVWMGRPRKV